ncbi:MAG: HEAT repeat domain-containing protein [Acidobacteria bacterium]|nr:HEAT repeat domain-containing protein [Acidobacteriota bacterium]
MKARFFTPKHTYLVGEPIFVTYEFINNGQNPVWVDTRFGDPCFGPYPLTVEGASRAHEWETALNCAPTGNGGSCLSTNVEIKPGQAHSGRIFVNHYYQLDQPGTYEIRIDREVPVLLHPIPSAPASTVEVMGVLDIRIVPGTEDQLKGAFQPVLKDLNSTNSEIRWQAVQAVTKLAQPFLQQAILNLSKKPNDVWAAIEGLYKLNTPQDRERLAQLAEHGETNATRERAMRALAALGDKHYLPLFYRLARSLKGYEKGVAIESAGLLGGSQAVPFLSSFVGSHDPAVRMAAIRGLAGTASRSALVPLILQIRDRDPSVREVAGAALVQLTHLSTSSNFWAPVPNPALTFQKWHDWWLVNGFRAPIYGPNDCAEPKPLN